MDFRDIEYFAVVAEHRHVGRAAEALGLSQPALSLSLRRLEKSMDAKLVRRTPKGVELTEVGAALLAQVRRLRLVRDDVIREVADLSHGRAGNLRIGAHPGVIDDLLAPACSALLKAAPKVKLTVMVESQEAAVAALRDGGLDLVVIVLPASPDPDFVEEHLIDDVMVVFASARHHLARRKQITIDDLSSERWTATAFRSPAGPLVPRMYEQSGRQPPDIAVQTTSLSLRNHLVATTDLLGTSSRRVLQQVVSRLRVVELPVRDFQGTRRIGVCYRRDAYLSPVARRLLELLRETAKEITGN